MDDPRDELAAPARERIPWTTIATALLLGLAVAVRSLEPAPPSFPEDAPGSTGRIREPMQLLGAGARIRIAELGAGVAPEHRRLWESAFPALFALEGCPRLQEWLETGEGQRVEQLIDALRRDSPQAALGGLALIFQLARVTDWDPGLRGHAQHAERLAWLLQEWLRIWAERSAASPLLHEPAVAAVLLYGRSMRASYRAPAFQRNRLAADRARAFVDELMLADGGRRSDFGEVFQARFPLAYARVFTDDDFLLAFEQEAAAWLPNVTGACPP